MFQINELDHVALSVSDVEQSTKFYLEVVGLTLMERPAIPIPGSWLRIAGRQAVHIVGGATQAAVSSSRGNHFAMAIRSMAEAEAHLKSKGVTYTGPHQRADGAMQIFFQDPDGHTVEFCVLPK